MNKTEFIEKVALGGRDIHEQSPEVLRSFRAGGDRDAQKQRGGTDNGLW